MQMQLKITVRSAEIFKRARLFSKMHLYAVVEGPSSPPQSTEVDMHGGGSPFWWAPMELDVGGHETLVARIKCRRGIMGSDKTVGVVELPARALLDYYRLNSRGINVPLDIALAVASKSGKPRGVFYVSYVIAAVDPRPLPSAPPLAAVVPSVPYLPHPDEIMLHSLF